MDETPSIPMNNPLYNPLYNPVLKSLDYGSFSDWLWDLKLQDSAEYHAVAHGQSNGKRDACASSGNVCYRPNDLVEARGQGVTGLLLRNLKEVTIRRKPYYLLYTNIMVT